MNEIKNPVKAIRAKCLDCCCNNPNEVKLCPIEKCALYPFRLGKNPYHKLNLSDEQRAALSERAKRAQAARKAAKDNPKNI